MLRVQTAGVAILTMWYAPEYVLHPRTYSSSSSMPVLLLT